MEHIRIVTDTTADLSVEQVDRYGIELVPLTVSMGGRTYTDGPGFDAGWKVQEVQRWLW